MGTSQSLVLPSSGSLISPPPSHWLKGTEKKMLCETSLFLFQNFNVADFKAPKSNA